MKYCLFIIFSIICFHKAKGQEIKFIKNGSNINTAGQLFDELKGKTIFLDLWAPWCEPCKEEFKYSDSLYIVLKKRKITMLYLSLNTRVETSEWKAAINQYRLKGYHVLANANLENDITNLIWGHPGGFSIPHYLLISSKGSVLLKDALSPDNGSKLYHQIDSVLRRTH